MVKGCSNSCVQYILFTFNFIFLILGALIFGFGTYILVRSSNLQEIIDTPDEGAILVMITGSSVFLLSFVGCFGAIKESQNLLRLYGIVVGILALLQIAGAFLLLLYSNKLDNLLNKSLFKGFEAYDENKDDYIKKAIDNIQYVGKCCGYNGPSFWRKKYSYGTYPQSCCFEPGASIKFECTNEKDPFERECKETVREWLQNSSMVVVVAVITSAIIQIFAACFACMLANAV